MPDLRLLTIALALSGALVSSGAAAQTSPPSEPLVSVAQLREDFAIVKAALYEGAANLHRYRSPAAIEALFARTARRLDRPMTPDGFWRVLQPALAQIGDGHLKADLPAARMTELIRGPQFPLRLRLVDGRMYVLDDASDRIPRGSEIVAINGIGAGAMIRRCGDFISADNGIAARKIGKVQRDFWLLCVPALDLGQAYRVRFRPAGRRETAEADVKAIRPPPASPASPPAPSSLPTELRIWRDAHVARLTLPTLQPSERFRPDEVFKASFAAIAEAQVTDLILDLRGNTGGPDTTGARLFSHLALRPFRYVTSRTAKASHFEFLKYGNEGLNRVFASFPKTPLKGGGFQLNAPIDDLQPPQADAYRGRVYVLIDNRTFSTGSEVASAVRHERRGLILGEESGTVYGGSSGAPATITLPHTKVTVDVPLVAYRLPGWETPERDRAVQPDVRVVATLQQVLAGDDPVLDQVVSRISEAQKRPIVLARP